MKPKIIEGNTFEDHRGSVAFVNDFNFNDIERFYIVSNSNNHPVRAWQGHKIEVKNFYCIQGSVKIYYIKIDNWENPSLDLPIESVTLNANESKVLQIPAGYANAIKCLEPNSRLLSFATLPIIKVKDDDIRFETDRWKIDF